MSSEQETPAPPAPVAAQPQWPVVVTLRSPVEFGKEHIAALEFRRGCMGDLKGLGVSVDRVPPLDQLMMIASRLCGKPVKVIELLQDEDSAEVIELALDFFVRCLGAGKTP